MRASLLADFFEGLGHKKIHFTFEDGAEMVEEWSVKGDLLRSRKWRGKATLGGSKVRGAAAFLLAFFWSHLAGVVSCPDLI